MSFYYVKSVGPAALERKIGEAAYKKCEQYRLLASIPFYLVVVNYLVYFFYPLSIPVERYFPWDYLVTAFIATVILIPSLYLMFRGVRDAGKETMSPRKEHTLYGGIYEIIRHPQALGEVWLYLVIGLYLNSPFLALFSLIFLPLFYYFSVAEERDLAIRYGQAYVEYRNRTGMFFPKLRRKQAT
jgi:protein-S-isoprenylcysteine O-methyltransferase Ste14